MALIRGIAERWEFGKLSLGLAMSRPLAGESPGAFRLVLNHYRIPGVHPHGFDRDTRSLLATPGLGWLPRDWPLVLRGGPAVAVMGEGARLQILVGRRCPHPLAPLSSDTAISHRNRSTLLGTGRRRPGRSHSARRDRSLRVATRRPDHACPMALVPHQGRGSRTGPQDILRQGPDAFLFWGTAIRYSPRCMSADGPHLNSGRVPCPGDSESSYLLSGCLCPMPTLRRRLPRTQRR